MALPQQLKTARMTDSTAASTIDNEVGNLEQAIADILGGPVNTNITAALFEVVAGGLKSIYLADAAADPTVAGQIRRNGTTVKIHNGTAAIPLDAIPTGTRMVFHQTTAPTGWTKDTTAGLNDNALRVVTGAASSGGTVAFSTVMGTARGTTAVSPGGSDNFTLTPNEMPAHSHTVNDDSSQPGAAGYVGGTQISAGNTGITGSSGAHAHGHSNTHSHTSNLNVLYQDVIIASKN